LEALLDTFPPLDALAPNEHWAAAAEPADPVEIEDLVGAVSRLDPDQLKLLIRGAWARQAPLEFLERTAAPLLAAVGDGWAAGRLEVRHEHFASGILGDFLRTARSRLEDRAAGPLAVLATLPGELHGLGLHMAALVFAQAGWRHLLLGVDTPVDQLAALAREAGPEAVAISCVQRGHASPGRIRALRRALPQRLPLLLGGKAAPRSSKVAGVEIFSDLSQLDRWAKARLASR
jgi:methanogenic corrinoid protein MtbC1